MSKTVIKLDEGWRAYLDSLGAKRDSQRALEDVLRDPRHRRDTRCERRSRAIWSRSWPIRAGARCSTTS